MDREVIALKRALDLACGQCVNMDEDRELSIDEYMAKKEALIAYYLERGETYADKYIETRERLQEQRAQEAAKSASDCLSKKVNDAIVKEAEKALFQYPPRHFDSADAIRLMSKEALVISTKKLRERLAPFEPLPSPSDVAPPSNVVQLSEVIQQEGDATFFEADEEFDFAPLARAKKQTADCPLRPQLAADQEGEG